ncbi:MAG: 4Fe-4S cluster-binding domain-containing protein, partial [Oscillospiraceae bacterium]|nr:4Fe-4S cluster-binding domain-containing protein [Oscillospiraceae bacterium]
MNCNLKCKLCAERSPYRKNSHTPTLGELTWQIDELFALVDNIEKFDITGGEPFLCKCLPEFISYLYNNYRNKITQVRLSTNGTILPSAEFIESAKLWKDNFFVIVDNYPVSKKCNEIINLLTENNISHTLRDYSENIHCNGWVDYGDLSLKHTKEEARELYNRCMVPKLGFFTCMVEGNIYPCAKARHLAENSSTALTPYVTMSPYDFDLTETGKRERLKSILGEELIDVCRYCNGLCEDSKRYIPAEQLNSKELSHEEEVFQNSRPIKKEHSEKVIFYTQANNAEKT